MLVSIGYSACHWCHVMERESFEDPAVADLMNTHFVCIKVDREERPDVDQIYMDAVQLMRGNGGWPLNCFTLPDGRPIYGGTYFTKPQFMQILYDLATFYKQDPAKADDYARNLTEAIRELDAHLSTTDQPQAEAFYKLDDLVRIYAVFSQQWDAQEGGAGHAPKFPVPCKWQFLLRYAHFSQNPDALQHLKFTLHKMAQGGIYDQLGGGFARYSTDAQWFAPHFEKMLYDNAQLVSLYADAYRKTREPLYAHVVQETLAFVLRELTHPSGGFYSALDADSEGIEGKYYVWSEAELETLLGAKAGLVKAYYNTRPEGNWEHGLNILHVTQSAEALAAQLGITQPQFLAELDQARHIMLQARTQRVRPALDDKILAGWNGLMCKAYVDAYNALGNAAYLATAEANMAFVYREMQDTANPGKLYRNWKNGKATLNAYLEDYACVLEAELALYQATFNPHYLQQAEVRMQYLLQYFLNPASTLFYFTSSQDSPLIARKTEVFDSVLPSSNSQLAHALLTLSHLLGSVEYGLRAKQMLRTVYPQLLKTASGYKHWAALLMRLLMPDREVAIVGSEARTYRAEIACSFIPDSLLLGSTTPTTYPPLLAHKGTTATDKAANETMVYVCQNQTCQLPVGSVAEALAQLTADEA